MMSFPLIALLKQVEKGAGEEGAAPQEDAGVEPGGETKAWGDKGSRIHLWMAAGLMPPCHILSLTFQQLPIHPHTLRLPCEEVLVYTRRDGFVCEVVPEGGRTGGR